MSFFSLIYSFQTRFYKSGDKILDKDSRKNIINDRNIHYYFLTIYYQIFPVSLQILSNHDKMEKQQVNLLQM